MFQIIFLIAFIFQLEILCFKNKQNVGKGKSVTVIKSNALNHGNVAKSTKNKHLLKIRRSEVGLADNHPILIPEASNGFERAIQTDIDDLNNPRSSGYEKRDTIEALKSEKIGISTYDDHDDKLSISTTEDGKTPYELVSQTALHYSSFISDEMRIISEIQLPTVGCKDSNHSECRNNSSEALHQDDVSGSNSSNFNDDKIIKCNQWSVWGMCNETCTNGVSMRYRDCYDENNNKKPQHQFKECSNPDCIYCSEWSKFTSCTKICGIGARYQTRNCYLKNGTAQTERKEEGCNYHSCLPDCGNWSDWSDCSKPCDDGVSIRKRNCSVADGTNKTFYEHQSCNTQPCSKSNLDVLTSQISDENSTDDQYLDSEDGCLSARITFERYQFNVRSVFDETDEHNDVEYKNMVLFNGNHSCGYSGALSGRESYIKFYDDIFMHFEKIEFSAMFWIYLIDTPITSSALQTLFSFESSTYDFGHYVLTLNSLKNLRFAITTNQSSIAATSILQLNSSTWYHVAAVYSEVKSILSVYINGKKLKMIPVGLEALKDSNGYVNAQNSAGLQFQGFGNDISKKTPFSGVIDEINVFKCAMNRSDVMNIANTCRLRQKSNCPTPLHGLCTQESLDKKTATTVMPQVVATPLNT